MNNNPQARRILCYGDSNTWGFIPLTKKRYPADIRWTGILQSELGQGFEVIEEGLNSRTINVDDPNNFGRNGKDYLIPCLKAHNPLNIVILMLGTNDLKVRLNRSISDIENGIRELIAVINDRGNYSYDQIPEIILLAPPILEDSVAYVKEKFAGAKAKSLLLPEIYQKVSKELNCGFINTQEYINPSPKDGCHLEPEDHKKLGLLLADKIQEFKG